MVEGKKQKEGRIQFCFSAGVKFRSSSTRFYSVHDWQEEAVRIAVLCSAGNGSTSSKISGHFESATSLLPVDWPNYRGEFFK